MATFEGYDYNSQTGTWVRNPGAPSRPVQHPAPNQQQPPPLPPKEPDLIKETQHASAVELEGSSSTERVSLESLPYETQLQLQQQQQQQQQQSQYSQYYGMTSARPASGRRKIRVLSLDGGGIRGYSTLVILQELMHQVYVLESGGKAPSSPNDLPRPCDYFDLIGGNGTGGLLALMLGRMRMDVESCKSYYSHLTRFVFITDKTLLGMPYGKTLFKASRLEEAIKHCVRESTRFDTEKIIPHSPPPPTEAPRPVAARRSDSWRRRSGRSASIESEPRGRQGRPSNRRLGNPEAPLLDTREGACKTFVTTMLEGSRKGAQPVLLRSYPSPAESVPSYKTTIWQAGRATCATASAFKSVTIDHNTFLDEGSGQYNPAFQVLDEARIHEFPDAEVATFVSVGTGKRQKSQIGHESSKEWWESIAFEGFAEAKRRLMRRIDDCERVHRELVDGTDGGRPRLAQSGVAAQDYYRFNVEVGVGEFGMNEWNRLAEVSTGTRRYLAQRETSRFVKECAAKLVAVDQAALLDGSKVAFRPTNSPKKETNIIAEMGQNSPPVHPPHHPAWSEKMPIVPEQPAQVLPSRQPQQQQQPSRQEPPLNIPTPEEYGAFPRQQAMQQNRRPSHPALQQQQQQQQYPPRRPSHPPPLDEVYQQQQQQQPQSPIVQQQQPPVILQPQPQSPTRVTGKPGKILIPAHTDDNPVPELRVTSPTTVAGGSDSDEEEHGGRRKKRLGRRRAGSRGEERRRRELEEVEE